MHTNSFKNNNDYSQNIIINNLIIKNRCNKLIYNNNLIKNEYINGKKLKENNRYKGISQMTINNDNQYKYYKPYSLRTDLNNDNKIVLTYPE